MTGLGRAFAGGAAIAAEASTVFTNPAGMTRLTGSEAAYGFTLFLTDIGFEDRGTTASTPAPPAGPTRLGGGDGGTPFEPAVVPTAFIAAPILDGDLWIGLGLTSPFGLALRYKSDWFGRYDTIKSRLVVADIAPSVAWRVADWLSVGGGIDVQYANATLSNAIPDTLQPGGPTVATDGLSELEGDDWSVGYNVGVLLEPLPGTRLGVHYRAPISHDLKGKSRISGLTGALAAANGSFAGTAGLDLPGFLTVGIAHELTPHLTLLGEAQWFDWSRFEDIRIRFDDGMPDVVIAQDYADSYAVSIGFEYAFAEAWTARAGVRYDATPTVDRFRSASVPDADSFAVGFGLSYRLLDALVVDVAYYHARWQAIEIDLDRGFFAGTAAAGVVNTRAEAESRSHILGLNLRYRF